MEFEQRSEGLRRGLSVRVAAAKGDLSQSDIEWSEADEPSWGDCPPVKQMILDLGAEQHRQGLDWYQEVWA